MENQNIPRQECRNRQYGTWHHFDCLLVLRLVVDCFGCSGCRWLDFVQQCKEGRFRWRNADRRLVLSLIGLIGGGVF